MSGGRTIVAEWWECHADGLHTQYETRAGALRIVRGLRKHYVGQSVRLVHVRRYRLARKVPR